MSVMYEVNVQIDSDILDDYLTFLREKHIPDLLSIEGFLTGAILFPDRDELIPPHRTPVTCMYKLQSRELLQRYFDNEAPAMRTETLNRFPGKMSALRRILALHAQLEK